MTLPRIPRSFPAEQEAPPLDPMEFARILARGWRILVAGVVVGMLVAAGYTLTAQRLYRASMKLIVVAWQGDGQRLDPSIAARYVPFIRNADAIERAIKAAKLDGPADKWKLRGLHSHMSTTISKDAPIIDLVLDFPDPAQGGALLQAIADQAIKLNREMLSQSDDDSRRFLQAQLTLAAAQLATSEGALQALRETSRLTTRQREIETLLSERARLSSMMQDRSIQQSQLSSSATKLADELGKEDKILSLNRMLPEGEGIATGRVFRTETVNPLYEVAQPELVKQRADLAGQTAARARILTDMQGMQRRVDSLSRVMVGDQLKADGLQVQVDLHRAAYKALFELHESARVAVTAKSADLKMFETPAVGGTPISPRTGPALMFGVAFGFAAGAIAVLMMAFIGASREPSRTAADPQATHRVASL